MLNILRECSFLADVTARDELKSNLKYILSSNETIPTLLLCGEAGVGKSYLAQKFACWILAEDIISDKFSDTALISVDERTDNINKTSHIFQNFEDDFFTIYNDIFNRINSSVFPDCHIIKKSDDNKVITTSELREYLKLMPIRPQLARHVIWLIDISDISEQGQNILLKSLEEAPDFVVMILMSDNSGKVLNTIRSRSQSFIMNKMSFSAMKRIISHILEGRDNTDFNINSEIFNSLDEEKIDDLIRIADGNPGKLLALIESDKFFSELVLIQEELYKFINNRAGVAISLLFNFLKVNYKERFKDFVSIFTIFMHDMIQIHLLLEEVEQNKITITNTDNRDINKIRDDVYRQLIMHSMAKNNFKICKLVRNKNAYSTAHAIMQGLYDDLTANANFEIAVSAALLNIHEVFTQ